MIQGFSIGGFQNFTTIIDALNEAAYINRRLLLQETYPC